jgi:hypothetical protein
VKNKRLIMERTWLGMTRRLVWKVSKPRPLRLSVRYWLGGPIGIWNKKPIV